MTGVLPTPLLLPTGSRFGRLFVESVVWGLGVVLFGRGRSNS